MHLCEQAATEQDPQKLMELINEINRILLAAEFRVRLTALGIEPIGGSPEDFARLLAAETGRWTALIRELGISAQ
jgi:tripartite-type tricarboxylate transporter receptor subunit TctC